MVHVLTKEQPILQNTTSVAMTTSATLTTAARNLVRVSANAAGYILAIPARKSCELVNVGSYAINLASQGFPVALSLGPGERAVASWDTTYALHTFTYTSFVVDPALNTSSSNAIANGPVATAIAALQAQISGLATVTATAHGLVSGDIGKPIQDGAVYSSLVNAPDPRGVLVSIVDANTIQLGVVGSIVNVPNALKGTGLAVNDLLDWDAGNAKYEKSPTVGTNPYAPQILRINSLGASTFNAVVLVG